MSKTLSPNQRIAVSIVFFNIERSVRFAARPVLCEGMLIGHVARDEMPLLVERAEGSEMTCDFEFGPAIRGGLTTGLLDGIPHAIPNDENGSTITVSDRTIRTVTDDDVLYVAIHDHRGEVIVEGVAIDALIESLRTISAKRASLRTRG